MSLASAKPVSIHTYTFVCTYSEATMSQQRRNDQPVHNQRPARVIFVLDEPSADVSTMRTQVCPSLL